MVKKTVLGLMVLTALLWSTRGAQARDLFTDMQVDVFALAGGATLVDSHYLEAAGRPYYAHYKLGQRYTFGVGVPWGKLVTIETAYTQGPSTWSVTNQDLNPRVAVLYPIDVYRGSMGAVVRSPNTYFHIRPYADLGLEFDRFSPTAAALATATNQGFTSVSTATINHNDKFGMNAGFGLERKLTKRLTFRIDLRDHVTTTPRYGLTTQSTAGNAATFPVLRHTKANDVEYSAGIVFHLG